jgi:hypothetical protein
MRTVEKNTNWNVPRPDMRKPKPLPPDGERDTDGFIHYTCKGECGETKIAALFLPEEIASGGLVCRACSGAVRRRSNRGPRTWQRSLPSQRPSFDFRGKEVA